MNVTAEPNLVARGFAFCEGPAFAPDGTLWLVNLKGGFISRIVLAEDGTAGEVATVVDTPGPNGGQFNANGAFLVCECRRRAIIAVTAAGEAATLLDRCDGRPFNGPNDLAVDADGGFYFTDPEGSTRENPVGAVYFARPDRTVVRVDDGLAYPNGINITADRRAVLLAETLTRRIHRYERRADGTLGPRTLFVQLEEEGVGPDGMAFDQDANLYVTHFGAGRVTVVNPDGRLIGRLPAPGRNPTNCCFGPPGSPWEDSLFVTETQTDAVWRYRVGVPGMPLHHLAVAGDRPDGHHRGIASGRSTT